MAVVILFVLFFFCTCTATMNLHIHRKKPLPCGIAEPPWFHLRALVKWLRWIL